LLGNFPFLIFNYQPKTNAAALFFGPLQQKSPTNLKLCSVEAFSGLILGNFPVFGKIK
jgi:hypothetical protein